MERNALSGVLKIKLASGDTKPPIKATVGSAGIDLFLNQDIDLTGQARPVLVGTGVHAEIPEGYVGILTLRSGVKDCWNNSGVGIIDSDYRGEIKLKLLPVGTNDVVYSKGDRIAQLVIIPYYNAKIELVDELSDTDRGEGGFGHTGRRTI